MTTATMVARPPQAVRRRRPRYYLLPPRERLFVLALLVAFVSAIVLVFSDVDHRAVLMPMFACVTLATFFLAILYRRDGELPVFESGALWVAATMMYAVWPLLNFFANDLRWQVPSDWRLAQWDPTPQQMGAFAWNHVLYLGTFVVVYLALRGRRRVPRVPLHVPPAVQSAVIVTFVVMMVLVELVQFVALPPEAGVSVYEGGNFAYRANVPLVILQFLNIATNALLALKLLFAVLVLTRWREMRWRIVIFLWIPLELVLTARNYSRSAFVLLLLMIAISYHRLVRPLTLRVAAFSSIALVGGFLAYGVYRDTRGLTGVRDLRTAFIQNNEFQALFGNAYDIKMRRQLGVLQDPPPQMKWSELYMLIPSQLLPFEKVDPNDWYAGVLQINNTGMRTMFGVIAQAMLGYGKIELFLRAVLIAVILAYLHRWYVRRADRFWPTALYAYVSIWTFYTFRASTLMPLYFVVYHFGAAALLVAAVKFALSARSTATVSRNRT